MSEVSPRGIFRGQEERKGGRAPSLLGGGKGGGSPVGSAFGGKESQGSICLKKKLSCDFAVLGFLRGMALNLGKKAEQITLLCAKSLLFLLSGPREGQGGGGKRKHRTDYAFNSTSRKESFSSSGRGKGGGAREVTR